MELGPVRGPLTSDEYARVRKFTNAVEETLATFFLGQQIETKAEIRYSDNLQEYPLVAIEFSWPGFANLELWKSLRYLEELDSEHDLTYDNSVLTIVKNALTSIATRRV